MPPCFQLARLSLQPTLRSPAVGTQGTPPPRPPPLCPRELFWHLSFQVPRFQETVLASHPSPFRLCFHPDFSACSVVLPPPSLSPPPRPPRTQRNPAAPRVTTAGVFLTVQLQCLREPGCTNPGRGGTLNSSCASASSRLGSSSPRVTLSSSGTWVCVCPGAAALPPPLEASRLVALLLGSSGGRWPERIPSPLRVPSYH